VAVIAAAGCPVVVTVNVPAAPIVNVAVPPLVKVGGSAGGSGLFGGPGFPPGGSAGLTAMVNVCVAAPTALVAVSVTEVVPVEVGVPEIKALRVPPEKDRPAGRAPLRAMVGAGKPLVVIANTIKGKGVSFMEDVAKWHHGVPSDAEYAQAIAEIDAALAKAESGEP